MSSFFLTLALGGGVGEAQWGNTNVHALRMEKEENNKIKNINNINEEEEEVVLFDRMYKYCLKADQYRVAEPFVRKSIFPVLQQFENGGEKDIVESASKFFNSWQTFRTKVCEFVLSPSGLSVKHMARVLARYAEKQQLRAELISKNKQLRALVSEEERNKIALIFREFLQKVANWETIPLFSIKESRKAAEEFLLGLGAHVTNQGYDPKTGYPILISGVPQKDEEWIKKLMSGIDVMGKNLPPISGDLQLSLSGGFMYAVEHLGFLMGNYDLKQWRFPDIGLGDDRPPNRKNPMHLRLYSPYGMFALGNVLADSGFQDVWEKAKGNDLFAELLKAISKQILLETMPQQWDIFSEEVRVLAGKLHSSRHLNLNSSLSFKFQEQQHKEMILEPDNYVFQKINELIEEKNSLDTDPVMKSIFKEAVIAAKTQFPSSEEEFDEQEKKNIRVKKASIAIWQLFPAFYPREDPETFLEEGVDSIFWRISSSDGKEPLGYLFGTTHSTKNWHAKNPWGDRNNKVFWEAANQVFLSDRINSLVLEPKRQEWWQKMWKKAKQMLQFPTLPYAFSGWDGGETHYARLALQRSTTLDSLTFQGLENWWKRNSLEETKYFQAKQKNNFACASIEECLPALLGGNTKTVKGLPRKNHRDFNLHAPYALEDGKVYSRNKSWIPGISEMLLDKKVKPFIAVGAAHLWGEKGQGLIGLLKAEGFALEPIRSVDDLESFN